MTFLECGPRDPERQRQSLSRRAARFHLTRGSSSPTSGKIPMPWFLPSGRSRRLIHDALRASCPEGWSSPRGEAALTNPTT